MVTDPRPLPTAPVLDDTEVGRLARQVAARFMRDHRHDPAYKIDLVLEALLGLYDQTRDDALLHYVQRVFSFRGDHPRETLRWIFLFTGLHYETWLRTGDARFIEGWVDEAHTFDRSLRRDANGLILFPEGKDKERLLIDLLQGYASFMARASALTGDPTLLDRAMQQYALHEAALRDPDTGLWHHGRDWIDHDPGGLSPPGWCRGQAWILRGMVQVLEVTPPHHPGREGLIGQMTSFVDTLLRWQGADGAWHQVVQEPDTAPPETSGTGMIAHYLWKAAHLGFLPEPLVMPAVERAVAALITHVDEHGHVFGGCAEGRPAATLDDYRAMPLVTDDLHAIAGVLMGCSTRLAPEAWRVGRRQTVTAPV